jgi:hypothetical protein
MRKHTMIPLQVYKTSGASLQKAQWRLIDPGALSPWNVMSWGVRQLKGFVVGSDGESAPKLQVQELVLVENLQVCISDGVLIRRDLISDSNIHLIGSGRFDCEEGHC